MRKLKKVRPYLIQMFKNNKFNFIFATITCFAIGGLNLAISWEIQQLIDTVSGTHGSTGVVTLTWIAVGLVAAVLVLKTATLLTRPRFIQRGLRQYRDYAFRLLMGKSQSAFSKDDTSIYLSAFTNDAGTIENGLLDGIFNIIFYIVLALGTLAMMLLYDPLLTLIACGFCLLPLAVSVLAGRWAVEAEKKVAIQNQRFMGTLKDALSGFSTIRGFHAEEAVTEQFQTGDSSLESAKRSKGEVMGVIDMATSTAGILAQLGTFLVGSWLAIAGRGITPGVLVLFINLTGNIMLPVQMIPTLLANWKSAIAMVEKLDGILSEQHMDTGEDAPNTLKSDITLQHVSFGYSPDMRVLNDVSLTFKAGKRYAVVGSSGSGKSTLLRLLAAQRTGYDGSIQYDGKELNKLRADSICGLCSVIEQNVFLFNASIHDNITMFQHFSDEEVNRAVQLSGLGELVQEKGAGVACGENGGDLSGGERQRVSIARSLLRRSSVLLVDEATASLDRTTAHQVSEAILNLTDVTCIIVTHDLNELLLRRYDGIVAIRNGRVEEQGTFDELMEHKGFFYSLYTLAGESK